MSGSPTTARDVLFDEQGTGLARTLLDSGAVRTGIRGVRRLSASVTRTVTEELGAVGEELLEIDLGDALVAGWRTHASLEQAARRTLERPHSEEVVVLAAHTITSTHRPAVDLCVDGVVVNSFEFELVVVLVLTGVAAVVRAGQLVAVRGGRCDATVTLSLEGARLLRRERSLDLALLLPLRPPRSLVASPPAIPRQSTGSRLAEHTGVHEG